MNEETRIIRLASPAKAVERSWSWENIASDRPGVPGRWFGRGLLRRDDFATLKKGDVVRVVRARPGFMLVGGGEETVIGEARVVRLNSGSASAGGQPWAVFEALDAATRAERDDWLELQWADKEARMHWVPSRPPAFPAVVKRAAAVPALITGRINRAGQTDKQVQLELDSMPDFPRRSIVSIAASDGDERWTGAEFEGAFRRVPDGQVMASFNLVRWHGRHGEEFTGASKT